MPDTVAVSVVEGVATVTGANPPVNALDDATLEGLGAAARGLAGDEAVRAVVLTGAGDRAFLAGADLRSLQHALGTPGEMEAHVALTRPVFDVHAMEHFLARIEGFRIPVIAGIWPFESALNAEFMANEVPGVTVPEPLLQRMRAVDDDEAAASEGVRIAQELGEQLRPMVQGLHIASPSGQLALALRTLEGIRP